MLFSYHFVIVLLAVKLKQRPKHLDISIITILASWPLVLFRNTDFQMRDILDFPYSLAWLQILIINLMDLSQIFPWFCLVFRQVWYYILLEYSIESDIFLPLELPGFYVNQAFS